MNELYVNHIFIDGSHVQATLRRPALSGSWWKGLYGEHGPCRELFLVRILQIMCSKIYSPKSVMPQNVCKEMRRWLLYEIGEVFFF